MSLRDLDADLAPAVLARLEPFALSFALPNPSSGSGAYARHHVLTIPRRRVLFLDVVVFRVHAAGTGALRLSCWWRVPTRGKSDNRELGDLPAGADELHQGRGIGYGDASVPGPWASMGTADAAAFVPLSSRGAGGATDLLRQYHAWRVTASPWGRVLPEGAELWAWIYDNASAGDWPASLDVEGALGHAARA